VRGKSSGRFGVVRGYGLVGGGWDQCGEWVGWGLGEGDGGSVLFFFFFFIFFNCCWPTGGMEYGRMIGSRLRSCGGCVVLKVWRRGLEEVPGSGWGEGCQVGIEWWEFMVLVGSERAWILRRMGGVRDGSCGGMGWFASGWWRVGIEPRCRCGGVLVLEEVVMDATVGGAQGWSVVGVGG